MTKRTKIIDLLNASDAQQMVLAKGWIRTQRESKDFSFIELNDGSCLANIQIIVDNDIDDYAEVVKLTTGAAISVLGELIESIGRQGRFCRPIDCSILTH